MGLRQAIRRLPLGNVPVYVKLIQKVEPFIDGTDVKFAARWGLLVIGTGLWFARKSPTFSRVYIDER